MNEFMTHVTIPELKSKITYHHNLFFIGSCFSDTIGAKMKELLFPVCHNPFGVIYNPLSVASNLGLLLEKESFTEKDLSFYNELWFSYSHYTRFSHPDKEKCLKNINSVFKEARQFIYKANFIFITLGTSWVFQLMKTGQVVANCHKQPASLFHHNFISSEQSYESLKQCIKSIKKVNPDAKFIFTVSPIRHWKDGAINNQRSKAALLLAIAKLQEWDNEIYYFPAYEIFMDELRDYRFYASDMLHPSESAENYIWKKFIINLVAEKDLQLLQNVQKIVTSVKHKPLSPDTKAYSNFKIDIINKIKNLSDKNRFLDFTELLKSMDNNV